MTSFCHRVFRGAVDEAVGVGHVEGVEQDDDTVVIQLSGDKWCSRSCFLA